MTSSRPIPRAEPGSSRRALLGGLLGLGGGLLAWTGAAAHSDPVPLPAYAEPGTAKAPATASAVAVLAGGCFWGVQAVFQHVKGVDNAVSGYAGGDRRTAVYQLVGSGLTGHAEAVEIRYDPRQVSFAQLLQVYFSVAHDPTQVDRQGPDSGPQYRSAVFPLDDEQARVAQAYIAQLNQARVFRRAIATRIEPGKPFFAAEDYHQDFLVRNPRHPYIVINDQPKIEALKRLFPALYRAEPVLVSAARKPA